MSSSPLPPDLQPALERLFKLFSEYVAAGNAGQRRSLHNQILNLFAQLGVISDSVVVRQAAELFERIRREPGTPKLIERTIANEARDLVNSRVRLFERRPHTPSLTAGARQLLRIPVAEAIELGAEYDPERLSKSLDTVFASLREAPANTSEGTVQVRTSIAVIRSFWKNFCRIPPFCSGGERE